MQAPPISARVRALRWLAPVGVVCVAALAATGAFKATASSEGLPSTTPAALIAAVQTTDVEGFSGTVVSHLSLGLPELPNIGGDGETATFSSLLTGSHTMQVWYGGSEKQRVALLGATDETDLFRNGNELWQWSSADQVAVHTKLPARTRSLPSATATPLPSAGPSLTPVDLARRALHDLDPTTKVVVDEHHTVADRSAYELVLTPRTTATTVGSVRISVDGDTKTPLGVQVYPRGSSSAAVDVAFTNIHFGRQAARNFVFSPPPNATVHDSASTPGSSAPQPAAPRTTAEPADSVKPRTIGSGWATVVALKPGRAALTKMIGPVRKTMTPVSGAWGSGRLLESALVSVLVIDDGRLLVGAVPPSALFTAAGSR